MFARIAAGLLAMFAATEACSQTDLAAAFGARPELEHVSLSPDGTHIAYVVPTKGQGSALLTVALGQDGAKPLVAFAVDGDPERLAYCSWIDNERIACRIWGVVDNSRDSQSLAKYLSFSRTIAVDANGGNLRLLSRSSSAYARGYNLRGGEIVDWLPDEPGMVLMTRNQLADDQTGTRFGASKSGMVVEKVNSRTLAASKVEPPREWVGNYLSDGYGNLRVMSVTQVKADDDNTGIQRFLYRDVGSRDWKPLVNYDYVKEEGFLPVAVDQARNAVYGFQKKDGRKAVYRMMLDGSGTQELVFARPDVDVDDLITLGRRNRVVGATFVTDVRQAVYFDGDLAKLAGSLAKALPKQPKIRFEGASQDEKKLLIWAGSDQDPGLYYVLDRATRQMAIFQPMRPQLEGLTLARMQPVSVTASDGAAIPSYLTLPAGASGKGLPAIVLPHGGPDARDEWGFDWLAQYYAARGFAVLQPNFRGSAGYGDAWADQHGYRAWKTAVGDVTDAGRWLVKQGIADPAKLAIVGWSYGGYAALQSAVVDPGLFKAVVAIAPVTDLPLRAEQAVGFTNYQLVKDFVGTGPTAQEGSPARNAGRIRVPVFLAHGTVDRNVHVTQSRLMDDRLREAGVEHELLIFDKLDHYLEDSVARARLLSTSDAFLRKSLGM